MAPKCAGCRVSLTKCECTPRCDSCRAPVAECACLDDPGVSERPDYALPHTMVDDQGAAVFVKFVGKRALISLEADDPHTATARAIARVMDAWKARLRRFQPPRNETVTDDLLRCLSNAQHGGTSYARLASALSMAVERATTDAITLIDTAPPEPDVRVSANRAFKDPVRAETEARRMFAQIASVGLAFVWEVALRLAEDNDRTAGDVLRSLPRVRAGQPAYPVDLFDRDTLKDRIKAWRETEQGKAWALHGPEVESPHAQDLASRAFRSLYLSNLLDDAREGRLDGSGS